jgi:hypothetical protein
MLETGRQEWRSCLEAGRIMEDASVDLALILPRFLPTY